MDRPATVGMLVSYTTPDVSWGPVSVNRNAPDPAGSGVGRPHPAIGTDAVVIPAVRQGNPSVLPVDATTGALAVFPVNESLIRVCPPLAPAVSIPTNDAAVAMI